MKHSLNESFIHEAVNLWKHYEDGRQVIASRLYGRCQFLEDEISNRVTIERTMMMMHSLNTYHSMKMNPNRKKDFLRKKGLPGIKCSRPLLLYNAALIELFISKLQLSKWMFNLLYSDERTQIKKTVHNHQTSVRVHWRWRCALGPSYSSSSMKIYFS